MTRLWTLLTLTAGPLILAVVILLLPEDVRTKLKDFQTFLGGTFALGAAAVGYSNLQEQLREQQGAEFRKNDRDGSYHGRRNGYL